MNFLEMFNTLESEQPMDDSFNDVTLEPEYVEQVQQVRNWTDEYKGFCTTPVLYNMDGYISNYPSSNWGSISPVLEHLTDESRLPSLDNKLDPNKIFNADTSALRALAADQNKATKLFEKKLLESLSEKGKIGLNELDIMAMQALTAARGAVTNIQKEQVGIKKNIAELKIKQQQNAIKNNTANNTNDNGNNTNSSMGTDDIGRSILDNIFSTPGISTSMNPVVNNGEYQSVDLDSASSLLDNITNTSSMMNTSSHIQYENDKPTTYVVVGDRDDDVEYVTYSSDGIELTDYPNPTTKVSEIDRNSNTATDELLVSYPIKYKNAY